MRTPTRRTRWGIVRGLAWTSVGGDTLQIEVNIMPGDGKLQMTGQMGDVMKESAQIALTYVRSVASSYGVDKDFFKTHDIHLHIPEGAVPKDGPSAGITMATAMLSAVTGKKVKASVAMTGELTLRGRGTAHRRLEGKDLGRADGPYEDRPGSGEEPPGYGGTFQGNYQGHEDRICEAYGRGGSGGVCLLAARTFQRREVMIIRSVELETVLRHHQPAPGK